METRLTNFTILRPLNLKMT